jgi:Fe-S-cluster formation regulator IscX/YfhJ
LLDARRVISENTIPVLESLKDKNIDLDTRWQAYTKLVEGDVLTDNETYGDGYIDTLGPDMTQYDDFNNDRGQTVLFIDMYQRIVEAEQHEDENLYAARENLAEWQERVLEKGNASFTYDW